MRRFRFSRVLSAAALVAAGLAAIPTTAAPAAAATLPALRVGDASVVEGDAGSAVVNVPVDLTSPPATAVTVTYTIQGGSATAGSDFAPRTGKLRFGIGVATKQLSVVVFGDTVDEPDETVDVHLSAPVNATIDDGDGTVTIVNDDADGYSGLQANISDVSVTANEAGTHKASLTISLSEPAPSTIKVYYVLSCGIDPTSGLQIHQHGTVTFQQGQQSKQLLFTVPLDQNLSQTLQFLQTITVALGPAVTHQGAGIGTVYDPSSGGSGPPVGTIWRASVTSSGDQAMFPGAAVCSGGPRGSLQAALSGDGRYVAFTSDASNLVPDDTNGLVDAFVHDNLTGSTERDSVFSDGRQVPPDAYNDQNIMFPSISGDGRYVTFFSQRPLIDGLDPNVHGGIYLHDRVTGVTELVSRAVDGSASSYAHAWYAPVSDDGRYVMFIADNGLGTGAVVPDASQSPSAWELFVRDRVLGTTTLVSRSYNGGWANAEPFGMSSDGRYVMWGSSSPNVVPNDTNGIFDYFVSDLAAGTTERVSVGDSGQQLEAGSWGVTPPGGATISADGRFVVFSSGSPDVVAGGPTPVFPATHLYLRDRLLGTTELIPDTPTMSIPRYPDISADGRFVTYQAEDTTTSSSILTLYDRSTGDTSVVGQQIDGTLPDGDVGNWFDWFESGSISRDGRYVAFTAGASNLVPDDTNDAADVFVQRVS